MLFKLNPTGMASSGLLKFYIKRHTDNLSILKSVIFVSVVITVNSIINNVHSFSPVANENSHHYEHVPYCDIALASYIN